MKKSFLYRWIIFVLLFVTAEILTLSTCLGQEKDLRLIIQGASESGEKSLGRTAENTMKVIINGKEYTATLDQGKAAQELKKQLPFTLTMQELNGNEKYGDLPEPLTQAVYSPGEIHAGDILLWGSDTLVVFYKDFSTPYSYTKIGRIDDPEGLREAAGKGRAEVAFQ